MFTLKPVLRSAIGAAVLAVGCSCLAADQAVDRTQLPIPSPPFAGKANRTLEGSKAQWPRRVDAPPGAPT